MSFKLQTVITYITFYNRAELEMEKDGCHLTQIKSQIIKIVNTDHGEMTFSGDSVA